MISDINNSRDIGGIWADCIYNSSSIIINRGRSWSTINISTTVAKFNYCICIILLVDFNTNLITCTGTNGCIRSSERSIDYFCTINWCDNWWKRCIKSTPIGTLESCAITISIQSSDTSLVIIS